jgi:chromosome segregation ATPase
MVDPLSFFVVFLVSFSLGFLTFSVFSDCVQEQKEYSRHKSLFIRDESGVWATLSQQRVLVEEAQKWLSDRNAEMAKLRVAYTVVKEEAMQAWAAEAVIRTGMDKAREEAAQAHRDLELLSRRVKELEENVLQVSRQRDTLNVEVEQATAHADALKDEVTTLKGAIQEKDVALESARQEIEALKETIGDKDNALQGLERTCGGLRNEVMGLQTHIEGKCDCYGHDVEGVALGINLFIVF